MNFDRTTRKLGGAALIIAPILQIIGFLLHPQFLSFKHNTDPAQQFQFIQSAGWQWGHILVYISIPIMLFAWMQLVPIAKKSRPILTLVGAIMTWMGYGFLAGAFGAVMMQGTIGLALSQDQAMPAIAATITNSGMMQLTFIGQVIALLGSVVLLIAAWSKHNTLPSYSVPLALIGNVIVAVAMDIDAIMIWGSVCILVGLWPLAIRRLGGE